MTPGWLPGRDRKAVHHAGAPATSGNRQPRRVLVAGGGIAGITAAVGLAERGIDVVLIEKHPQLGGRVRAWPVTHGNQTQGNQTQGNQTQGNDQVTMSRGFHAFFRQYYNLRSLIRRVDPALDKLAPITDYPLQLAGGHRDSFARLPRTPPWSIAAFVWSSPSFSARELARVDVGAALALLDLDFPATFSTYDGQSAADFLDRLRFPSGARHLALEVFARSFFADPRDFSAGELVAMFHSYFVGSAEGLLFDVPVDDYDTTLWSPLGSYLDRLGAEVCTGKMVKRLDMSDPDRVRVALDTGQTLVGDALVLATDLASTRRLIATEPAFVNRDSRGQDWRRRIAETSDAPPFAVWRLWLNRLVDRNRPAFLGTSGYGPLDNITVLDRFEYGAQAWSERNQGSVLELHAYALPSASAESLAATKARLRAELGRIYPETAGAEVRAEEWLVEQDCPLIGTGPWLRRPEVRTPDPRMLLAGDGIRCDYPVALMERAATTGWLAANALLGRWGLAGHDLWTVPLRGRHRLAAMAHRRMARGGE